MNNKKPKILTVDDEAFNLDILETDLQEAGFEVIRALNGSIALAKLQQSPDIDVVVLDRMMPVMDGMRVIREIKANPLWKDIPIIMQTAAGQSQQVREGLEAGVYYYLTKPYNEDLLISIVRNALRETAAHKEMHQKILTQKTMHGLLRQGSFRFRTLQDVSTVAYYVANCCPKPDTVVYGLNELMINAAEHGNLSISYAEKMELVLEDRWQREVERRLLLPENMGKYAYLTFEANDSAIIITIRDQGAGFNWRSYLDFDPVRMASDPHGKGIAIAKVTSFPDMEFKSNGTEVICRLPNF